MQEHALFGKAALQRVEALHPEHIPDQLRQPRRVSGDRSKLLRFPLGADDVARRVEANEGLKLCQRERAARAWWSIGIHRRVFSLRQFGHVATRRRAPVGWEGHQLVTPRLVTSLCG